MVEDVRVCVFLFTLFFVKSQISLYDTNDGLDIEFYDCVQIQSLDYCRRPKQPINLTRENDTDECEHNGGQLHTFSELRSKNITVRSLIEHWRSTFEQLQQYSLFLKDINEKDGSICECHQRGSFGKNCEYQLPVGETLDKTLQWQLNMRNENEEKVQIYGDVVCYKTLECESGELCLDWREICDGIQHCLEGKDEENCDLLEINQCDEEEEYRCENGMCIPQEFFLDGERDCLDWSDEIQFKIGGSCPLTSVSSECDDHLCPPNEWSCGDGQCLEDRLTFQRWSTNLTCHSRRDQYFICETHLSRDQWTMENGRCLRDDRNQSIPVKNRNDTEEQCEYLIKCLLSVVMEQNCSCSRHSRCIEEFDRVCRSPLMQYPRRAVVTPFTFFLFDRQRDWRNKRPDGILISGTVRCRNALISVRDKAIPFDDNWNGRQLLEEHFCRPYLSNISSSNRISIDDQSSNRNESLDRCGEWREYFSSTRIRDGEKNCLNGKDEEEQTAMQIEKSCVNVRQHRFHCSADQPTCLGVTALGIGEENCRNGFDELWFGVSRMISSIRCNNERQDQCSLLRQYIEQSSKSKRNNDLQERSRLPFRLFCDTFSDLPKNEDETLLECQRWWICPEGQRRCQSGQCFEPRWINDREWDCPDAVDEHARLNRITENTLLLASWFNFTDRSFFVPSSCPKQLSLPFLCLSSNATRQGFSCFNLSQISDGNIDCAGGMDEQNTLQGCSQSSLSTLGSNFLCPSTNTCIPFLLHCWKDEYRYPNRSDDQFWCDRQRRPANCSDLNDFVCFDGQCLKGGRCNAFLQCLFLEDEYMCDYRSSFSKNLIGSRKSKRFSRGRSSSILRLSRYPSDVNITQLDTQASSILSTLSTPFTSLSSSLSPYWCNRGLGILSTNNHSTILCFCPPQYYGKKCEFHSDRLSVVLHLDLSSFIQINRNDRRILLKLIVLFLFDDEVLMIDQFHLHPSVEFDSLLKNRNRKKTKLISHFLYPRSSTFLDERRRRFFNRSSLLSPSPFSIRVELYGTRLHERSSLIALWMYPIDFTHLPVSRLSKVLHFTSSSSPPRTPCLSNPCHPNAQCHQLINNRSEHICLCKTNFTGENCSLIDEQCRRGYCTSTESLCQPNSRSSLRRNSLPFCLCPLDRYGPRCSIEHDECLSHPCQNDGSCFPDSELDRVICVCGKEYFGARCEMKRSSIHFSLSTDLFYRGVVLQVLQIDLSSL